MVQAHTIRQRNGWNLYLEDALYICLTEFKERFPGQPLTDEMLKEAANRLNIIIVNKLDPENLDYIPPVSSGYITRWKDRNLIVRKKINGEQESANKQAAYNWTLDFLPELIEQFGEENVYNIDEFALYYLQGIDHTLGIKEQKEYGIKKSKKRITGLIRASVTGKKSKILLIGPVKQPHCFRGHMIKTFTYNNQRNAWINSLIFNSYLHQLDADFRMNKKFVAIICDNCSAHATYNEQFTNISIYYLPANTTSIAQPMDAGVIHSLKKRYKSQISQQQLDNILIGKQLSFDLFKACVLITHLWNETKIEVIQHEFQKAWNNEDVVSDEDFNENTKEENEQTRCAMTEDEICDYILEDQLDDQEEEDSEDDLDNEDEINSHEDII
ncbi:MAG: putative Tigger transposable element-derived protein 6, partial [Streblomastix strix]